MSLIKNRKEHLPVVTGNKYARIYRVNIPTLKAVSTLFSLFFICLLTYSIIIDFSETTPARGVIISAKGDAEVRAKASGTIVDIPVTVGQYIEENQVLFTLTQDYGGKDGSVIDYEAKRYQQEKNRAEIRIRELKLSVEKLKANLILQHKLIDAQIAASEIKINKTKQLVKNTQQTLDSYKKMIDRGYVSQLDLNQRTNDLLNAQLNLKLEETSILQLESNKSSLTNNTNFQIDDLSNQALSLSSRVSEIDRTLASRGSKSLAMLAPISGYVVAINFPPGRAVTQDNEVVMVIRHDLNSPLEGYVYIPSTGAGRIHPGESVKVHFDAWPVDKYGTVTTTLKDFYPVNIDAKSALITLPQGQTWYLARISLPASFTDPNKHQRLLMGGMTLGADIVVDKKPLIAMLIAPLDRVRARFLGSDD